MNTIKVLAGKKWGRDQKTLKRVYNAICRSKIDYGCQLYNTAFPGKLKKLNSIHRKGIRIYTDVFRKSPVELLHIKAYDPLLVPRKNELGLRFLYKLRSNPTYT